MNLIYACHIKSVLEYNLINYNLSKICNICNQIIIVYSVTNNLFNHTPSLLYNSLKVYTKKLIIIRVDNKGYDFFKYKIGILNLNNLLEPVILMNNSFIFIRNISDILNTILLKINMGYEFIGMSESNIIKPHYQSWFWVLNNNLIKEFILLLDNKDLNTTNGSFNIIIFSSFFYFIRT